MAKSSGRLLAMVRSAPTDPDQTAVLDAALDAFLDFGVRRASMGEIAKRSRLSPATLYRRFAQKSDIVQAVGLREVQRFLTDVDRRVDHRASAEDQLAELFVAVCGGIRRHRLLRRLIDTEPEVVLPLLTTQGGPVLDLGRDYVAEFIRRLQGDGALEDYDAEPVAEVFARLALSMALTPRSAIPMADDETARSFARSHLAPVCRPTAKGAAAGRKPVSRGRSA